MKFAFISAALLGVGMLGLRSVDAQTAPTAPVAATPTIPEIIPAQNFAAFNMMSMPHMSPSGKFMAARVFTSGKVGVIVHPLKQEYGKRVVIPISDKMELNWIQWASDDRLLVSVTIERRIDSTDVYFSRVIIIDHQTSTARYLGGGRGSFDGDDVIYVARDGSYALLSYAKSIYNWPSVYKVDLTTNEMTKIQPERDGIFDWYADNNGVVRAGMGWAGEKIRIIYRETETEPYKTLIKFDPDKKEERTFDYIQFLSEPGQSIVYTDTRNGRYGLYKYDWKQQKFGETVYEHPSVDIDDFDIDETTGKLLWVIYTDDRARIKWFDAEKGQVQADLEKAVPNQMVWPMTVAKNDNKKMLVSVSGATNPGSWYYYNTDEGVMQRIAHTASQLKGAKLAPMMSADYVARDGLKIPAYLTLPVGKSGKNLPLIVMPHGGPIARDSWNYDYLVQFLANRGYAVLQPNFRGSLGYGRDFVEKGYGQHGTGIQNDVVDGTRSLIAQGIADPKKICVFGWSYGGYVAEVASYKTEGLFKCAISVAGISDLSAIVRTDRRLLSRRVFADQKIMWKGKDEKHDLKANSALYNIDKISIPILLAHGEDDVNVPVWQSDKFDKALTAANKPHEYYRYPKMDHSLTDEKIRTDLLEKIEAFLNKYNPAP